MDTHESSTNSTFSFFYKNLTVAGFYEENALFMTVKELFDNSIDALSNLKIEEKKVEIVIKECNKDLSFYEIICRDNGEGIKIKDLENFGEMFLTSKENCKTTGKFGIGLKTILLYSFKTAYGFLHIKIKIAKNKIWDFALVMDKSLNHTFVENFREYIDEKWSWTVEISVILKINDKYISSTKIFFYIKLTLLWKRDINVKCTCVSDQFEYCCNRGDNNSISNVPSKGASLIKADGEIHLGKRSVDTIYYKKNKGENRTTYKNNGEHIFDLLVGSGTSLLVKKELLSSFNFNLSVITNVRRSNKITCSVLNVYMGVVFLIRYANSMPLMGANTECSLRNDFKNFLRLHGSQFGMELFSLTENTNADVLVELINLDSFNDMKEVCDIFYIKKSDKSTWDIIIVGVDVSGSDISFTNLNKNCIKEGEYLSSLTHKCLMNIFTSMKKELPQEFESLADYQLRQALNIYGTQLATSLSKIILKGREEFQNKVFHLLNESKKKQNAEKSEKDKMNDLKLSVEKKSEKDLRADLYMHIKNKILSMSNDKKNVNVNKKIESSGASSVSGMGDDNSDIEAYGGDVYEDDEEEDGIDVIEE